MAQFVRKNIDIISSTSRPTTREVPPLTRSSHSSESSSLDEHMTSFHGPLSAPLFENYSFMPKSPDPNVSSLSFRTAFECHHNGNDTHTLPLIGSSTTVATILAPQSSQTATTPIPRETELTSFQQLPTGYESIGEIYEDTTRAQTVLWAGKKILKKVKELFDSVPPQRRDPSQRTPDELERQPLLPSDPDNPENDTGMPEWYARLLLLPRIYFILAAVVVVILILFMIMTGDTTLFYLAVRGALCYILGSTITGLLFGDSFCPVIEVTKEATGV